MGKGITQAPDGWLTVQDASQRSGLTVGAIRQRLEPDHPDHLEGYAFPTANPGGQKTWRIREEDFTAWMEAHKR
jgi:hypothetical protein